MKSTTSSVKIKNGGVEMNSRDIDRLNEMIAESSNIVFFGGAGVSTESGIPDFRSANGIYIWIIFIRPKA